MKFREALMSCTLVFGLLALSNLVYGQDVVVSGTVYDETGQSLPGVTVLIEGTSTGTATDIGGNFRLSVPENAEFLVLSYIGYKRQRLPLAGTTAFTVNMELDQETLDEIVVIGYGVQKKEDLTGSVVTVGTKEFNKGAMNSPQDLIVGRTAGVQVTTGGGAPGSGATIRIRGGSSLSASNDPLIVIDGVPIANSGVAGMRNPLNVINPNDIETFTVLKDASATAIYGSRASNGVIIITTKKGVKGQDVRFNYSGNVSAYTLPARVDVLDGNQYRELVSTRFADNPDRIGLMGEANTDWQEEIFDTAVGTEHNLSANGAFKNVPFRASVGYSNQNGILKTSNLERTTLAFGINPSLFNDALKINTNIKYANIQNRFADEGAIGSAIIFDPTQPVRDPESRFGGFTYWGDATPQRNPISIAPTNPVAMLDLRDNSSSVNRIIGNVQFDYQLPFVPGLSANLNMGIDYSESEGVNFASEELTNTFDAVNGSGSRSVYDQAKRNELLDFYMKYNRDLGFLNSNLDVMAGYSWQHFYDENSNVTTNANGNFTISPFNDFATENYLISFFGRLNYNVNQKYLFTFTARSDGSSRFVDENRWGFFPSAAFAWRINEENFLRDVKALTQLKLRVGYGITGQQEVGGNYPALGVVRFSQPTAQYQFGNQFFPTARFEAFDPNLKWEETTTINAGIDFGFIRDRITGSIDFYHRDTKDLLNFINIPLGTNFSNFVFTNVGQLTNTGLEITLNATAIERADLVWDVGMNFTANRNEVKKLTLVDDPNFLGVLTGGISGGTGNQVQIHQEGSPARSFFLQEQVYDELGNPIEGIFVDRDANGLINDTDRLVDENPVPDVFMGFNSRLNYKNFNFSFNARANVGNFVYNNVHSDRAFYQNLYNSAGFLNNVHSSITESNFENARYLSNFYLRDASFFRMDNITAGYNFKQFVGEKLDLNVNFTVQNAFVITNYDGLDPEIESGIDNNIYPRPRTFILSVNLGF